MQLIKQSGKKTRKKKNEKKTVREHNERLMRKAEEVVSLITGGKNSLDKIKSLGLQIKLSDLGIDFQLIPHFHLSALPFLVENNHFEKEAILKVTVTSKKTSGKQGKSC